jgi:hypothetical protein
MHNVMAKAITSVFLSLLASALFAVAAIAAPEPCKDCNPETGLTIREQIKAERALEADRIAKESTDRPWDGKDYGRTKPTSATPIVHEPGH